MKLKHALFSVKQYFDTSSKMLWEMTRCHHIKKVITWGQPVKTKIPGRFVSISTKVWRKADRFMPQIPAFFFLPGSSATIMVGCWEAQASRFPAVQQPIWKGAKSLATRLPNFQATWQPAWRADGKPGRPWELLIPSTQILSSLGHLSSSNVPELPGNHSPNQHALNRDATQASTRAPRLPPQTKPLQFLFHKGFWKVWV